MKLGGFIQVEGVDSGSPVGLVPACRNFVNRMSLLIHRTALQQASATDCTGINESDAADGRGVQRRANASNRYDDRWFRIRVEAGLK